MTTSKDRLQSRLENARLLNKRLTILLADIDTAFGYAERTGHPALAGDIAGLRGRARSIRNKALDASKSLDHRIAAMGGEHGQP